MRGRKRLVGAMAGLVSLMGTIPAMGFDVKVHRQITTAAVKVIQSCVAKHGDRWRALSAIGAAQPVLEGCNVKQDELFRKFALWHFNSGGSPIAGTFWQGRPLAGDTSFNVFYAQLGARLDQTTEASAIYATTGAMLHYVQDAAVPAHAIPIYHPTFRLSVSSPFVIHGDGLDDFDFQAPQIADDVATCARLLDPPAGAGATYETILATTLKETLAAVEGEIPAVLIKIEGKPDVVAKLPRTWKLFWDTTRKTNGFADYGCGRDRFNKDHFRCGVKGSNPRVTVQGRAYQEFAAARHLAAVEASVRIIAAAARRLRPGPAPSADAACPVATSESRRVLVLCEDRLSGGSPRCGGDLDTARVAPRAR